MSIKVAGDSENGSFVRVAIVDLGTTSKYHKLMFWVLMGIGTILFLGMGVVMFGKKLGLVG